MPLECTKDEIHTVLRTWRICVQWDLNTNELGRIHFGAKFAPLPSDVAAWGEYLNVLIRDLVPELEPWPDVDLWDYIEQRRE